MTPKAFIKKAYSKLRRNRIYRTFRKLKFGVVELGLVILVAIILFFANTLFLAKDRFNDQEIKAVIPENTNARDISRLLYMYGLIDNRPSFDVSVKMLNFGSRLKAGTYYLRPNMSNLDILYSLQKGNAASGSVKVAFPEGSSIFRMAGILRGKNVIIEEGDFYSLDAVGLTDDLRLKYDFLAKVPIRSLEGYLFPDTYYVPETISMDKLVQLMLDRFENVVLPVYLASNTRKYSLHEIVTLASIVEKEAQVDRERPIIASVFYNRLEGGMLLRADPTVKYALLFPTKRVFFRDLEVESPFNTYKNAGLPPGPICNPGIRSILAALNPARTNYIYFVSNGDGTHTFSENWTGHAQAVERYKESRNK